MDAAHAFHRFINAQRYRLSRSANHNRQMAGGNSNNSKNKKKVQCKPSSPQPNSPYQQDTTHTLHTMESDDSELDSMMQHCSKASSNGCRSCFIKQPSKRRNLVIEKQNSTTQYETLSPEPIEETRLDDTSVSMNSTDVRSNTSYKSKRPLIAVRKDQRSQWEYDKNRTTSRRPRKASDQSVGAERPYFQPRLVIEDHPIMTSTPKGSDTDLIAELRDELQQLQRKFVHQSQELSTLHRLVQKLQRKCKDLAEIQSQTCCKSSPSESIEDLVALLQRQSKEVSHLNRLVRSLQLEYREMAQLQSQSYCKCGQCKSNEEDLSSQTSNQCIFCRNKKLPVLNSDLDAHLCRLIGMRKFADLLLTVMLRADNIYHINVRELRTNKVVGCLLASETAIDEAININLFEKILTFVVVDKRNTLNPRAYPFAITFEFLNENMSNQEESATKSSRKVNSTDRRKRTTSNHNNETYEQDCRPEPRQCPRTSMSWLKSASKIKDWISLSGTGGLLATQHCKLKNHKNHDKITYEVEQCRKCQKHRSNTA